MTTAELTTDGAMNVDEARRFAGVSRSELYRLMDAGLIAYAQSGRRRLVLRASVREWLRARVAARSGGSDEMVHAGAMPATDIPGHG
jgi:excisionase family DNA binding protein